MEAWDRLWCQLDNVTLTNHRLDFPTTHPPFLDAQGVYRIRLSLAAGTFESAVNGQRITAAEYIGISGPKGIGHRHLHYRDARVRPDRRWTTEAGMRNRLERVLEDGGRIEIWLLDERHLPDGSTPLADTLRRVEGQMQRQLRRSMPATCAALHRNGYPTMTVHATLSGHIPPSWRPHDVLAH